MTLFRKKIEPIITYKYKDINLPLKVFKRALIEADYTDIEDFAKIFEDFTEAIGGKELLMELQVQKKIEFLRCKIFMAEKIISMLSKTDNDKYQSELFELLKNLNYHIQIPNPKFDDIEEYCKQIKGWILLDVTDLQSMLASEGKKDNGGVKESYSYNYFMDMQLELKSKLNIDITDDSPTLAYCRGVVKYKEHHKALQEQAERMKK